MSTNTFPHVIFVSSIAELATVHVAELDYGTRAYIATTEDNFYLQASTPFPVDGTTVISPASGAIVGKPGSVWVIASKAGTEGADNPLTVVLATNDTNTTAVLAASPELQAPIAAGQHMRVEWQLKMTADVANGMQIEVVAPPGATGIVSVVFYVSGGGIGGVDLALGAALAEPGQTAITFFVVAGVVNGATPGTVALEFAQAAHGNNNPTNILVGSSMIASVQL